jgi:5' nucleotidase family
VQTRLRAGLEVRLSVCLSQLWAGLESVRAAPIATTEAAAERCLWPALQLERFACLYTSHVSNLCFYSPTKSYRARMNHMAHEEAPVLQPATVDAKKKSPQATLASNGAS